MKTFLMCALLAASFATPSAAQGLPDPKIVAERTAVMLNYDVQCGGLPPKTRELVELVAKIAEYPLVEVAMTKAMLYMTQIGKAAWCAQVRPWVIDVERAGQ